MRVVRKGGGGAVGSVAPARVAVVVDAESEGEAVAHLAHHVLLGLLVAVWGQRHVLPTVTLSPVGGEGPTGSGRGLRGRGARSIARGAGV